MVGQSGDTPKAVSRDHFSLLRSKTTPRNALDQTKRRPDKESHMRMFSNAMGDRNYLKKLLANKDANWYPGSH
jgi:phage terminase small subunit